MRSTTVSTFVIQKSIQETCPSPYFSQALVPSAVDAICMQEILDGMASQPSNLGFGTGVILKNVVTAISEVLNGTIVSVKSKEAQKSADASSLWGEVVRSVANSLDSKTSSIYDSAILSSKLINSLIPADAPVWAREIDYKLQQTQTCFSSTADTIAKMEMLAQAEKAERDCLIKSGVSVENAQHIVETTSSSYIKNIPKVKMQAVHKAYCDKTSKSRHCFTQFKEKSKAMRTAEHAKHATMKEHCNFKIKR